jgi:hypothetical protein
VWFDADFLLWRIKNPHAPTATTVVPIGLLRVETTDLQTTDITQPANPSPNRTFGFAPVSITSVDTAPGTGSLDPGEHTGGRITAGFYFDPEHTLGLWAAPPGSKTVRLPSPQSAVTR